MARRRKHEQWEDIGDQLTEAGLEHLKTMKGGRVLSFEYEGSRTHFKVMRIANGHVWVKEVQLVDPDDVKVVDNGQTKAR